MEGNVQPVDIVAFEATLSRLKRSQAINIGRLAAEHAQLVRVCRRYHVTFRRVAPNIWNFIPPPSVSHNVNTSVVIARGCILLLSITSTLLLILKPITGAWKLVEVNLKDYGLFTNLVASGLFALGIWVTRGFILGLIKQFIGIDPPENRL